MGDTSLRLWCHSEPKAQWLSWRGGGKVSRVRSQGWLKQKQCHPDTTRPLPYGLTVSVTICTRLAQDQDNQSSSMEEERWSWAPAPRDLQTVDASKGGKSAFIKSTAPVGWPCFSTSL